MARSPELLSRREVALAIPGLTILGGRGALQEDPAAPAGCSTAILLRHAEKDAASDPKDPSLSPAGQERARALARLLGRAGATHLFASEFRRTRETLDPLAEARSLQVESVPAGEIAKLAERIRALPAGSVSVVAGHSNTVPAIAKALGATLGDLQDVPGGAPMLRDAEYARLFVITLPGGAPAKFAAHAVELAYGA